MAEQARDSDLVITIQLRIKESAGLEDLVSQLVEAVRANDTGTRQYNFSVDSARATMFVIERYSDPQSVLEHMGTVAGLAPRFFEQVEVMSAYLHCDEGVVIPEQLKEALTGFGIQYMTFLGRFESL